MAKCICLLQFTEQGIRAVTDTTKRAAAATAAALFALLDVEGRRANWLLRWRRTISDV